MTISAVILTSRPRLNPLLIQSLSFVDEIVVIVDSPSAKYKRPNLKSKIFTHPLNGDFAAQRNYALQKAHSDWVLFVDDDEYVGTELAREISALKNSQLNGYTIRRLDLVFHRPLYHGETGRLRLLRLARRTAGKFLRPVHEVWQVSGRVGELSSPLYHIKDHFVSEFIGRMTYYGRIDAQSLSGENKPFSWWRLLIYPPAKFGYNYLLKAGFLDGFAGLFLAYLLAVQSLSVRVFQWANPR